MTQELAEKENTGIQPVTTGESIIQIIGRMATDPNADVDKMERMLDMQERVMNKQAESEFSQSMNAVQGLLPNVVKDANNGQTNSKYAKHEAIARAIKPIYTAEGLSLTFSEGDAPKENYIRIIGVLRHKSGYSEQHHLDLPLDVAGIKGSVNKTDIHGTGSTYTYGRRYLTCMIFDVSTGDDNDGNGAVQAANPYETPQALYKTFTAHMTAAMENLDSVIAIKEGIASDDLELASEAWFELEDDIKADLWVAVTKGSCFTKTEKDMIKSRAFRVAHYPNLPELEKE